jgi:hypothetical protein
VFLGSLMFDSGKAFSQNYLNWVWSDYSNSSLLLEKGDFSMRHWWWFRPERRPSNMSYILMNYGKYGLPSSNGCAFNPNGMLGKKYTVVKSGITFEYYVYEKVGMVSPVPLRGGTVVAQTKGPRITGGAGICGVRYFAPKVPVKITLPF